MSEADLRKQIIDLATYFYGVDVPREAVESQIAPMRERTLDPSLSINRETYVRDFGVILRDRAQTISVPDYIGACNQLEDLIQDAGKLIDRCLLDKTAFERLATDRFLLRLELAEALAALRLEDKKMRDSDFLQFEIKEAEAEGEVYDVLASDLLPGANDLPQPESATRLGQYSLAVFWEKLVYTLPEDQSYRTLSRWAQAAAAFGEAAVSLEAYKKRSELQKMRARKARKTLRYSLQEIRTRRSLLFLKMQEATRTNGTLNYPERIESIVERSARDFAELRSKLDAIAEGIVAFIDPEMPLDLQAADRPLDHAVAWLRNAYNRFQAYKFFDQRATYRVVLAGQELGGIRAGVSFSLEEEDVPNGSRLQAISAFAAGAGDTGAALEVSVPDQMTVGGTPLRPAIVRLGRVRNEALGLDADLAGVPIILNRSPVGEWLVRRVDAAPEELTLIFLDVHVLIPSPSNGAR